MIRIKTYTLKRLLFYLAVIVLIIGAVLLLFGILFPGDADTPEQGTPTDDYVYQNNGDGDTAYKQILMNGLPYTSDSSSDTGASDRLIKWLFEPLFAPQNILARSMPVIYGLDIKYTESEVESAVQAVQEETGQDEQVTFEKVSDDIKLEVKNIVNEEQNTITIKKNGPNILIYHTHTTEAYRQVEGREYVETTQWRTEDPLNSVVAVGDLLAAELSERYGFSVLHDKTNHEPPKLNSSYSRSLETMEAYHEKYENLEVFIDIHRDACSLEAGKNDVVVVDGKRCARIMFVVGTGEGKTGAGFSVRPNWKENFKLASAITNELNKIDENFTRPIRMKTGRYNQHVSDSCMLIEVGHNANSLEEAKNSVYYLAQAISKVLKQE